METPKFPRHARRWKSEHFEAEHNTEHYEEAGVNHPKETLQPGSKVFRNG